MFSLAKPPSLAHSPHSCTPTFTPPPPGPGDSPLCFPSVSKRLMFPRSQYAKVREWLLSSADRERTLWKKHTIITVVSSTLPPLLLPPHPPGPDVNVRGWENKVGTKLDYTSHFFFSFPPLLILQLSLGDPGPTDRLEAFIHPPKDSSLKLGPQY